MNFFKVLLSLASPLLVLVIGTPVYLLSSLVGIFWRESGLRMALGFNSVLLRLLGVKIQVKGAHHVTDSTRGRVFVLLNQTSLLDSMLGALIIPKPLNFVINFEFALVPVVGWIAAVFSTVIVRQWKSQSVRALKKLESSISRGENIYLSIEGKISKSGALSQYKKGPAVLAIRTKSEIVPVKIHGASHCLKGNSVFVFPGHVVVEFLPPIQASEYNYDQRALLVDRLYSLALSHAPTQSSERGDHHLTGEQI